MLQLGKLDAGVPQGFRIMFIPVVTRDIAAASVPRPRGAVLILLYSDSTAVSFQKPANLPLHFLIIPELIQLRAYLTQYAGSSMSSDLRFKKYLTNNKCGLPMNIPRVSNEFFIVSFLRFHLIVLWFVLL